MTSQFIPLPTSSPQQPLLNKLTTTPRMNSNLFPRERFGDLRLYQQKVILTSH